MQLTAAKRKQLHQALLSAFPTWPALEQMASFELNVNLATVAPETDLQNTVLRLITWAEAKDRVPDLTRAALKANPTNLKFQAVAQGLSAKKPVRPRSSSTRSRVRSSDVRLTRDQREQLSKGLYEIICPHGFVASEMLEVFCKRYLQIPDHVVHSWRFSTGHSTMSRLSFRPGAHVINELINWAWDNSRIRDLIEATVLERPSNLTMRKLAEELGVSVPVLSLRDRLSGYLDVIMRWFSPY